jgi:ABC-2 type transport system permease protein
MKKIILWKQLIELTIANFKEIIRQPGVLFWGIGFPILMALGLGIAFTQKANIVRNVAVVENQSENDPSKINFFLEHNTVRIKPKDGSAEKFKFTIENKKLGKTTYFFEKTDWENAVKRLKEGKWDMILNEKNNQVEYHFDPVNPDAQLIYLNLSYIFEGNRAEQNRSNADVQPLLVKGTRYIDFFVPGLIAMGIMMSCLWGLGYGVIERRSKKLLRRMVATPMKKSYFLLSLIFVRMGMSFVEAFLLFAFTYFVFDITIQGSIIALVLIFIAGNFAFAGISIFVCSRTANTEIGNGLINVVVLPMIVLSGIFFSYQNFPDWSIKIIHYLPLTLLADGVRSIFIEGTGLPEIAVPFVILMLIGTAFFAVGLKVFKWY